MAVVSKRCFLILIPRRRCIFISAVIIYIFCITWFQQSPLNLSFLTSALNLNCENRDKVCIKCSIFYDKMHQLKTCFNKILLNTKFEIAENDKDIYLSTKTLNVIANVSDFCNEEFFLKQSDIFQLVTVNGPKIGQGYGTSLFLKSSFKDAKCRAGFIGIDENLIIEKQFKTEIPQCEIMGLSQDLSNDTKLAIENFKANISEGILTKPESEEISNSETLANLIEGSFRQYHLDGLFIKYWFSLPDFVEFLEEIEISENSICQINARVKIPNNSFEAASKQFLNLYDSDFYPLHMDVRGNELQMFLVNTKRLYCVKKYFSSYCSNKGWFF